MGQRDLVKAPSAIAKGKSRVGQTLRLNQRLHHQLALVEPVGGACRPAAGWLVDHGRETLVCHLRLSLGLPMTGFVFVERVLQMTVPLS